MQPPAAVQPAGGVLPLPPILPVAAPAIAPPAAKSVGAKMVEKRTAEAWASATGPKYFLLRGGFNVTRQMDKGRLQMITKAKAHITEQAVQQVRALENCKVEHFFPPIAAGSVPTAMPAEVHLSTMVQVFLAAIEFGTQDNAPEICVSRVASLRRELERVVTRVTAYLQLHYTSLEKYKKATRDLLVEAINHGMNEWFHDLAVQSEQFYGAHEEGAPEPGEADAVTMPKFKDLKNLTSENSMWSLAERVKTWQTVAALGGGGGGSGTGGSVKRKATTTPPATVPKKNKAKTSGPGYPPQWACRAAWYGTPCRRPDCGYQHVNGNDHPTEAAPVATTPVPQQQQQPQQHQPPSLPPLQQPQTQQPSQQQQPQTAAGGAPRQQSVAHFSRVAGGGRGGGGRGSGGRGF
ncbi:unnamed protein product [Ectocarpus fasciculatus]